MQPSDSLPPVGAALRFPSRWRRPRCERFFCPGRACVRLRAARRRPFRLSASPVTLEEKTGPPGLLGRPLRACRGRTPRRIRLSPRPFAGRNVVAFRQYRTLGIRNDLDFEAATPRPARSSAFASPVPLPGPSPGWLPARAGSPLAGRALHPLDGFSRFHGDIAVPLPPRPAGPGRTIFPKRRCRACGALRGCSPRRGIRGTPP